MKNTLAIALGLSSWTVALAPYFLCLSPKVKENFWVFGVIIPIGWLLCTGLALLLNKGSMRRLWWVWPSAPFAFSLWMFIWGMFWVTRGFKVGL